MTDPGDGCRTERAQRAYPDFSVDPQAFEAHLKRFDGDLNVEDLYLAFAAGHGDRAALAVIEAEHLARIDRFVAHLGREPAFVDEIRQQVRERVLLGDRPRILDYSGRGSLGAWLRVTATRQALDLLDREKRHRPSDELEDDQLAATVDPELLAIRQRHLPQFRAAFKAALDSLDARERNLLRLYLVDGLNIGRIGEIFGKSRATIGRMVVDTREKLLEETRSKLGELTGASENDVRSLIRLLQSQLDVSIGGFLRRSTSA